MTTTTDDLTTTDASPGGAESLRDEMAHLRASTDEATGHAYHAPVEAITHDDETITVEFDPPLTGTTETETFAKPTPPLGWHPANRFVRWLEQTGYSAESLDDLADSDTRVPITYTSDSATLVVPEYTPDNGGLRLRLRRLLASTAAWTVAAVGLGGATVLTGSVVFAALAIVALVGLALVCTGVVNPAASADRVAALKADTAVSCVNAYTQLDSRHVRIEYSSTSSEGALNSSERSNVESHPEWQIVEREGDTTVVRYLGTAE